MSTQNFPTSIDLSPEKLKALASILKEEGIEREPKRVIARRPNSAEALLSFSQERIWFLDKLEPGNHYNDYFGLRIKGALNYETLKRSIEIIERRHETLRANFVSAEGQARQVIGTDCRVNLGVTDLSNLPEHARESEAVRLAVEEVSRLFDLTKDPLFRTLLIRLSDEEYIFLLAIHQVINDSWSLGVFASELLTCYDSLTNSQEPALPALPVQYADFAHWQRNQLHETTLSEQLSYWKGILSSAQPILQLPTDRPRPPIQTFRGRREQVALSANLTQELKRLSQREDTTLFMTLMAAFKVLLYRYTGQEDVIVGLPISIRGHAEVESLIGMFVNTLVLRTNLSDAPSFRELLARVREHALSAYAHQELPFELLVKETQPQRDLGHTPIFQVLFDYQSAPMPELNIPGLELTRFEIDSGTSKYDLTLELAEVGDTVQGCFEYNSDLFDRDRIARMATHFQTLLEAVVKDPGQSIAGVPLMTRTEHQQILVDWNDTRADYEPNATLQSLFEEQVERTPERVALVAGEERLTYRELNFRANQLARHLRGLGVGSEVLVGVLLERSAKMLVGLLGILKAGGAYVPLDPAYPQDRLRFMLQDSATKVLLTQESLKPDFATSDTHMVLIDEDWKEISTSAGHNPEHIATSRNLAYVIYTSGSTGKPKGVAIEHQSAATLIHWSKEHFDAEQVRGVLASTSICFDLSIFEIFMTLSCGGKVIVADNALQMPTLAAANEVTLINTVPSAINELVRTGGISTSVNTVCLAGEPLTNVLAQQIYKLDHVQNVFNLYGPTEDTTYSTWLLTAKGSDEAMTIGRPIANTQVYILDSRLNPVPVGVTGDLYLGGNGLARGYLNRPELTEERFSQNPFSSEPGARMYKTGDRARYLANGNIEFLGRSDYQVKIRGFRIEPGEIETALNQHPSIKESVVMVHGEVDDKRLTAYVIADGAESVSHQKLRDYLSENLPEYMLPSAFVALDHLPLTPNGKVDRRALPAPDLAQRNGEREYIEPRDSLEYQLTKVWEEVLGREPIGVRDNFFELGGHSLLAVRLFARIEKVIGRQLPLATLFQAQTIEDLARVLCRSGWQPPWSALVAIQPSGAKTPLFCAHAAGGNVLFYRKLAGYLGVDQPFYALQAPELDGRRPLETRVEGLAARYLKEIRALQPEGPYLLGGRCFGAYIALEMAQQLKRLGQQTNLLVVFDSGPPRTTQSSPRSSSKSLGHYANRSIYHLAKGQLIETAFSWVRTRKISRDLHSRFERFRERLAGGNEIAHLHRLERQYRNAAQTYFGSEYPGRVLLIRSSEFASLDRKQGHLAWADLALEGLDQFVIPGTHLKMFEEPGVVSMAEQLKAYLDLAHAET